MWLVLLLLWICLFSKQFLSSFSFMYIWRFFCCFCVIVRIIIVIIITAEVHTDGSKNFLWLSLNETAYFFFLLCQMRESREQTKNQQQKKQHIHKGKVCMWIYTSHLLYRGGMEKRETASSSTNY